MNACISVEGREGVEEERGLRSGEGNEGKGEFGVCRGEIELKNGQRVKQMVLLINH